MEPLEISEKQFRSRLFLGTGKFGSPELMRSAIQAAETELVTVAMKRIRLNDELDPMLSVLDIGEVSLLPNTSGVRDAGEAIFAARLAREAFGTNWLKLEVHPDPNYLLPDAVETLLAAETLVKEGFVVLPYVHADPVLCKRLEEVGVAAVMPLGSPIGSNQGLRTREMLEIIIEQSNIPVIVDAGIGAPSDAALALELGASAVLVNTAIAVAGDPVSMARAFAEGVRAGRRAFEAKLGEKSELAQATSPLSGFLGAL